MVGPSSSHTAGACKLGQFARAFFHGTPTKVIFYLHGSFGEVFKGHATDKALLAGVLKMRTSDPRIKDSFEIAKAKGLKFEFVKKDLGKEYHPNTVKVLLENGRRKMSMTGSSVGGGIIEIVRLNNFKLHLKGRAGKYLSLVICHDKDPSILKKIKEKLKRFEITVSGTSQDSYGKKTLTVINIEGSRIKLDQVLEIEKGIKGIEFVRSLSKLEKQ